MKRRKIVKVLAQVHEDAYREYQTLMALETQLRHDGKEETYREVAWYANGKSCLLDGVSLAASALGISADELIQSDRKEEAEE